MTWHQPPIIIRSFFTHENAPLSLEYDSHVPSIPKLPIRGFFLKKSALKGFLDLTVHDRHGTGSDLLLNNPQTQYTHGINLRKSFDHFLRMQMLLSIRVVPVVYPQFQNSPLEGFFLKIQP